MILHDPGLKRNIELWNLGLIEILLAHFLQLYKILTFKKLTSYDLQKVWIILTWICLKTDYIFVEKGEAKGRKVGLDLDWSKVNKTAKQQNVKLQTQSSMRFLLLKFHSEIHHSIFNHVVDSMLPLLAAVKATLEIVPDFPTEIHSYMCGFSQQGYWRENLVRRSGAHIECLVERYQAGLYRSIEKISPGFESGWPRSCHQIQRNFPCLFSAE